jgi:hypothetical protein
MARETRKSALAQAAAGIFAELIASMAFIACGALICLAVFALGRL